MVHNPTGDVLMIRVTLACMALAACTAIYNAAARASLDTAIQLAVMLGMGCVAGALYMIDRVRR